MNKWEIIMLIKIVVLMILSMIVGAILHKEFHPQSVQKPIPIIEADIKEPSATTIDRIETQKFLDELEAWNRRHGRMKDE